MDRDLEQCPRGRGGGDVKVIVISEDHLNLIIDNVTRVLSERLAEDKRLGDDLPRTVNYYLQALKNEIVESH